jgi:hypothetical protein
VSCVEQGRWQGDSHRFRGTGAVAPVSVRRIIKQTVTSALLDQRGRAADQAWIWAQIAAQQRRHRVTSATCALEASYVTLGDDLRPIAARLPYAPNATGLAIGIAGQLVSIDLFDQARTCELYWRQLVEGAALEALGLSPAGSVGGDEVEQLVARLRGAAWRPVPPVGEGEELRARTAETAASALFVDGCIVHLGAAVAGGLESAPRPMRRELPPELADRYRITARLGVGGVKEVFRATDLRGGPDVAIARIPYARAEHVEREAEIARRAWGPYVPRVHEAFVDGFDDGYLVMELCEGRSLAELADRPLPPAEAADPRRARARAPGDPRGERAPPGHQAGERAPVPHGGRRPAQAGRFRAVGAGGGRVDGGRRGRVQRHAAVHGARGPARLAGGRPRRRVRVRRVLLPGARRRGAAAAERG